MLLDYYDSLMIWHYCEWVQYYFCGYCEAKSWAGSDGGIKLHQHVTLVVMRYSHLLLLLCLGNKSFNKCCLPSLSWLLERFYLPLIEKTSFRVIICVLTVIMLCVSAYGISKVLYICILLVKGLWLCLWELWHSVINITILCGVDNGVPQLPQT